MENPYKALTLDSTWPSSLAIKINIQCDKILMKGNQIERERESAILQQY